MADSTRDIFDNEIRPFLFDGITLNQPEPTFTLLVGQSGAGRSRAIGQIIARAPRSVVPLRAADLEPFRTAPRDRAQIREWFQAAVEYARQFRVSIVIEDAFQTVETTQAGIRSFAGAGFRTEIVVASVSRSESLLAATARQVRRPRGDDWFRALEATVSDGVEAADRLVGAMDGDMDGVEFRIVQRDGTPVETPPGRATTDGDPVVGGALSILRQSRDAPLPGRVAAELISELRRVSEVAHTPGQHAGLAQLLVELHHVALREFTPGLPLSEASPVREQLENRLRSERNSLSAIASRETTPAPVAPVPEPRRPGISR